MASDDKPPRQVRRRSGAVWDDDKRVAAGRKHRRAPALGVPIVRDQVSELEEALPQAAEQEEITEPYPGELSAEASRLEARVNRLNKRLHNFYERAKTDSANLVLKAVGPAPDDRCMALESRMARTDTRLRILYGILAAIGVAVLGMAPSVIKGADARGHLDGEVDAHIQQLERAMQRCSDRLDRLDADRFRLTTPQPFQPKDSQP